MIFVSLIKCYFVSMLVVMQYSSIFTLPYLNSKSILFIFMANDHLEKMWNYNWRHLWLLLLRKNKCSNDDPLVTPTDDVFWYLSLMVPSNDTLIHWLSSLLSLVQQICNLSFDIYDCTQQEWNYSPNMPTPSGDCIWSLSHYLRWLPPVTTSSQLSHLATFLKLLSFEDSQQE